MQIFKCEFPVACLAIGILSIFSDLFAEKLSWAWIKVGHIMGKIISPILLALVFFGFLTPLAFLQKLFSKNDNLKFKNPEKTVFDTRDHQYTSKDLENLW